MDSMLDWKYVPGKGLVNPNPIKTRDPTLPALTTDDLLDFQFPLNNLSKATISMAQKAKWTNPVTGKRIDVFEKSKATPKAGIDIDDMLDWKSVPGKGLVNPKNKNTRNLNLPALTTDDLLDF